MYDRKLRPQEGRRRRPARAAHPRLVAVEVAWRAVGRDKHGAREWPAAARADKARRVPHGAHGADVCIGDGLAAGLAPRPVQPDMARLAVRVALVHVEWAHEIAQLLRVVAQVRRLSVLGVDKGLAAAGAEKVQLMVGAPAERLDRDEALVDDGRLAVVAPPREELVVVQVAVRLAVMLVERHVLKRRCTVRAGKAPRVPRMSHGAHHGATDPPPAPAALRRDSLRHGGACAAA